MSNYDEIFEKNFDKIRSQQAYVEEEDASRKSSIDSHIVELVNAINTSDNYFTTSSCSGRFIAYAQVYFYSMIENSIWNMQSLFKTNKLYIEWSSCKKKLRMDQSDSWAVDQRRNGIVCKSERNFYYFLNFI